MKLVSEPVMLPAAPAIWPVILSEELSGAPMARSLGAPFTVSVPARDGDADVGLRQQAAHRIGVLADQLMRRGGIQAGADGGERDGDRRDHVGRARHRWQRRQGGSFASAGTAGAAAGMKRSSAHSVA